MSDLTAPPAVPPEWYSVREAAQLLGLSQQGVRNRAQSKTKRLRTMDVDGTILIAAAQVESERAELLRTLQARDARTDRERDAVAPDDVPALRAEVARLTGVIEGLLVAGRGLAAELGGHRETLDGLYDALRSATFAGNVSEIRTPHQP